MNRWFSMLCAVLGATAPAPALAVDGVIEINQARALAGSVTPGDSAGFPVLITQPGSYRLTGNLVLSDPNPGAISITVSNVTIDLGGFAILGSNLFSIGFGCTAPASGLGWGIGADASSRGVSVRNGTVRGMGATGIYLLGPGARVERVLAEHNCGEGVQLGTSALIVDSQALSNEFSGFNVGAASRLEGALAEGNGFSGIVAVDSAVTSCVLRGNGELGLEGSGVGYVGCVVTCNNSVPFCTNGLQVGGPNFQMGTNVCGTDTTCP
jgi:hypothetical protein